MTFILGDLGVVPPFWALAAPDKRAERPRGARPKQQIESVIITAAATTVTVMAVMKIHHFSGVPPWG